MPVGFVVLDAARRQADNLSHTCGFGFEFGGTKEALKKSGDFSDAFFGQVNVEDAIAAIRLDSLPKIGRVDGDERGLSGLAG